MNRKPKNQDSKTTIETSYQYAKAKGWQTGEKVRRHHRNLASDIRGLAPFLPGLKSPHKRDIIRAACVRLASMPDMRSSPRQTMHYVTAVFTSALEIDPGKLLPLESGWEKLMTLLWKLNPAVAEMLNKSEYKAAFTWQLAGFADTFAVIANPAQAVLICQSKKKRRGRKAVARLLLWSGDVVPMPRDYYLRFPVFLPQGGLWRGEPVFSDSLANVSMKWPHAELKDALKLALWEPKGRINRKRRG